MGNWKVLSYEEVGKLVYLSLEVDRRLLEEGLVVYSDFDEEELLLCKEEELYLPVFGNGIGIKTVNIFDETCLLAIGVYGEDFTEVFNLSNIFTEEEVVSNIVGWFKTMEVQTNNTRVIIRRTDTIFQSIVNKQEEYNVRREAMENETEKGKKELEKIGAYLDYMFRLFNKKREERDICGF